MKANALTVVHKFIRNELFEACRLLATAGPGDIGRINETLDGVTELLHAHAAGEENYYEPQLREIDADEADRLMRDHHVLHEELDQVLIRARELKTQSEENCISSQLQLHLDWNRFVANYLLHLDDEERTMFAALSEIPGIEVIAEHSKERDPDGADEFLDRLIALIAPAERTVIETTRRGEGDPAGWVISFSPDSAML